MTLTPVTGLILLVVMILCGRQFRETWKAQSDGWVLRAWVWAVPAAGAFLLLALVPMQIR